MLQTSDVLLYTAQHHGEEEKTDEEGDWRKSTEAV